MNNAEITIGNIIENSHSTRIDNLEQGWDNSYNLQYEIGKYTLSIALGEGMYCTPREVFPHPSAYEAVEVGILEDGKLLTLTEILETFGDGVARHCEDYSNGGFGGSTLMPYVHWHTVAKIANVIKRIEGVNTPKWENEADEPF